MSKEENGTAIGKEADNGDVIFDSALEQRPDAPHIFSSSSSSSYKNSASLLHEQNQKSGGKIVLESSGKKEDKTSGESNASLQHKQQRLSLESRRISSSITGHNTGTSVSLDNLLLSLAGKNHISTTEELQDFVKKNLSDIVTMHMEDRVDFFKSALLETAALENSVRKQKLSLMRTEDRRHFSATTRLDSVSLPSSLPGGREFSQLSISSGMGETTDAVAAIKTSPNNMMNFQTPLHPVQQQQPLATFSPLPVGLVVEADRIKSLEMQQFLHQPYQQQGGRRKSCAKAALERINPRVLEASRFSRENSTASSDHQLKQKQRRQSSSTQQDSPPSIVSPNATSRTNHLRVDFSGFQAFASPPKSIPPQRYHHEFDDDDDDDHIESEEFGQFRVLVNDPLVPMLSSSKNGPAAEGEKEKNREASSTNYNKEDFDEVELKRKLVKKADDDNNDDNAQNGEGDVTGSSTLDWNIPSVISVDSPPQFTSDKARTTRLRSCLKVVFGEEQPQEPSLTTENQLQSFVFGQSPGSTKKRHSNSENNNNSESAASLQSSQNKRRKEGGGVSFQLKKNSVVDEVEGAAEESDISPVANLGKGQKHGTMGYKLQSALQKSRAGSQKNLRMSSSGPDDGSYNSLSKTCSFHEENGSVRSEKNGSFPSDEDHMFDDDDGKEEENGKGSSNTLRDSTGSDTSIKGVAVKRASMATGSKFLPRVLSSQDLSERDTTLSSGGKQQRRASVMHDRLLEHAHGSGSIPSSNTQQLFPPPNDGKEEEREENERRERLKHKQEEEEAVQGVIPLKALTLKEQHEITRQPHYFTPQQIEKEEYIRKTSWIEALFADISLILILFNSLTISVHVGLGEEANFHNGFLYFLAVLDFLMCVAAVTIPFFLPFERKGIVVTDIAEITTRNLKTPSLFALDIFSTFPVLPFFLMAGAPRSWLEYSRLNLGFRIIHSRYFYDVFKNQFPSSIHPTLWRLVAYSFAIVFVVTALTMFDLLLIRKIMSVESVTEWLYPVALPNPLGSDPALAYMNMWLQMIKCVTDKDMAYPVTDEQFIFALIACSIGLLVIIVLIASVEEIVVDIIKRNNVVQDKVESSLEMMEILGVPDEVQEEVIMYYRRMYDVCQSFDFNHSDDVLADLPDLLREDIEYEANARVIRSIPLFSLVGQNESFVRSFAGELLHVVFLPGAPIVNRGEAGDCMFFLSVGDAAVLDEEDDIISTVSSGAFFGEVSMLFGGEQPTTIVAVTLCVCYVITDTQFDRLVDTHPETLEEILQAALKEMKRNEQLLEEQKEEKQRRKQKLSAEGEEAETMNEVPFEDGRHESDAIFSWQPVMSDGRSPSTSPAAGRPSPGAVEDETQSEQDVQRMMELRRRFRRRSIQGSGAIMVGLSPPSTSAFPQDQLHLATLLGGNVNLGSRRRGGGGFLGVDLSPNMKSGLPSPLDKQGGISTTAVQQRRKSKFFLPTQFAASTLRKESDSSTTASKSTMLSPPFSSSLNPPSSPMANSISIRHHSPAFTAAAVSGWQRSEVNNSLMGQGNVMVVSPTANRQQQQPMMFVESPSPKYSPSSSTASNQHPNPLVPKH